MSIGETVAIKVTASTEAAIGAFNKLTTAVNAVAGAFAKVMNFAKEAGEMRQVEASFRGTGASLVKLQEAVEGTVSKMKLMQFANKAMRGELHLTKGGIETVLKAADALNDQGFGDTIEIAEKMTQALKTGSSRALREYGIVVDETKGKQATANQLLERFKKLAEDGGPEDAMNKRWEQMSTKISDLADGIKKWIGEAVLFVLESFESMIDVAEQLIQKAREALGLVSGDEKATKTARRQAMSETLAKFGKVSQAQAAELLYGTSIPGVGEMPGTISEDTLLANPVFREEYERNLKVLRPQTAREAAASRSRHATAEYMRTKYPNLFGAAASGAVDLGGLAGTLPGGKPAYTGRINPEAYGGLFGLGIGERFQGSLAYSGDLGAGQVAGAGLFDRFAHTREAGSFFGGIGGGLGGLFGQAGAGAEGLVGTGAETYQRGIDAYAEGEAKVDEIFAKLQDRNNAAGAAFGALSDGVTASVEAAISGSDSIGRAFAKAASAALKATAVQAAVNALFETAKGFAALAIGSPSAGAHFKAAAIFAATAAAAGVGAAAFGSAGGAGAAGATAGSATGGFTRSSSASAGGGSQNITVNIINGTGSSAETGESIKRALRAAERAGRTGSSSVSVSQ